MDKTLITDTPIAATPSADPLNTTAYPVIAAISFSHLLNDMMQSVLLAIYPLLKLGLDLSFTQIGLITLTYQFTGSLLQPLIGFYTDRRPMPYSTYSLPSQSQTRQPAPRDRIGAPWSRAAATVAITSSIVRGMTTPIGTCR